MQRTKAFQAYTRIRIIDYIYATAFVRQQSFHKSMAMSYLSSPDAPTAGDPVDNEAASSDKDLGCS